MRRKAGAGRPPPEIGQITPARALRTAIAQAAQEVTALAVAAGPPEMARVTLEPLCDGLPEHALLALIEGPQGRFGLVALDSQALAALVEIQTTGRVVPRAAEPRPPTRTDAIMCADFIDRILELFEARAVEAAIEIAPALAGYRYAMPLPDPRAMALTLDDIPYRQFRADLDLGPGAKTGELRLALPFDAPGESRAGARGDAGAFTLALQAQVMEARALLRGTLHRRSMTLAELAALAPGAEIEIPRPALGAIRIEDLAGQAVATGRLGQAAGARAIRLVATEGAGQPGAAGTAPARPALPRPQTPAAPGVGPATVPDVPAPGGGAPLQAVAEEASGPATG